MSTGSVAGADCCGEVREWRGHVPVTVNAHVRAASVVEVSLHPEEARVVLSIAGSNNVTVQLFTPRAELVRLIEVATAGLAELDARTTVTEENVIDRGAAGVESAA